MPKAVPPERSGESTEYSCTQSDEPSKSDVRKNPPDECQGQYWTEYRAENKADPELDSIAWRINIHGKALTIDPAASGFAPSPG
jgi:hypothetical protein